LRAETHRFYRAGLWLKGLNGVLELIGGGMVAFLPTRMIIKIGLAREALSHFWADDRSFAVIYLIGHGIVKCILAVLLIKRIRAAFPLAVGLFLLLIGYELYQLSVRPSLWIAGMAILDGAILTFIVVHHRRRNDAAPSSSGAVP
jgi:uncharacterized membrane protein